MFCMFEFCDSTQRIQLQVPFTPNPGGFFKVSGCLFADGSWVLKPQGCSVAHVQKNER